MQAQHDSIKQTADRIRSNSKSWSLEGDAEFLKLMTDISNNLIERGNKTSMGMHKMMLDLSNTSVGLSNVTNKLLALQNSQFIENRVQEDDEYVVDNNENRTEVDATPKEPAFSETLQTTFQSGIKMMNKYYDKVTFQFDDSDDEAGGAAQKSVLYLPKNLYKERHLPFLIGSKEWQEHRHIGLIDVEEMKNEPVDGVHRTVEDITDDTSMSTSNSERISDPDVDDDDEDNISNPINSNSDHSLPKEFKPAPVRLFYQEGVIDNSEPPAQPIISPTSATLFASDNFRSQYAASSLFDDQPPEIQEHPPVPKERKPANLFDDDESDEDPYTFHSPNVPEREEPDPPRPTERNEVNQPKSIPQKGPDPLIAALKTKIGERKSVNLFSDNDSEEKQTPVKNVPVAAAKRTTVAQQKVEPPKSFASIKTNLFSGDSDDDDDNSLFAPKKPVDRSVKSNNNSVAEQTVTNVPKSLNLFDDDKSDTDSQIAVPPKSLVAKSSSTLAKKATTQVSIPEVVDLFADTTDDNDDDLFRPKPKSVFESKPVSKIPTNLFAGDSSDDDNNIFSRKEQKAAAPAPTEVKPLVRKIDTIKKPQPAADVVAQKPVPITKIEPKPHAKIDTRKTNLFGDDTDDDDDNFLFAKKPEKITQEQKKSTAQPTLLKKTNLFGDSSEEDDPLFSSSFLPKSKTANAPVAKAKVASAIKETITDKPVTPTVTEPLPSKAPEPPTIQPSSKSQQNVKTKSIFTDDDESDTDLFGKPSKVTTTKPVPAELPPKVIGDVKVQEIKTPPTSTTKLFESENVEEPERQSGKGEPPATVDTTDDAKVAATDKAGASKTTTKNFDFLSSLLGEDPPDETFDIFKSTKAEPKKKSSFMTDSVSDEKNSLFDDSDFLGSDNSDRNQTQKKEEIVKQPEDGKTFGNYLSSQLFSEEPPEDDNNKFSAEPVATTKRSILGVFDDSSNLIGKDTVGSEGSSKSYNYKMLFDDEPPPDDFDEQISSNTIKKVSPVKAASKKSPSPEISPAPTRNENKKKLPSDSEPEVKASAAKPVASMTKRTPTKRSLPTKQARSDSLSSLDVEGTTTKPLDSLIKTRAKIAKPRRPSTRSGRQKQFEKYSNSTEDDGVAEETPPPSNLVAEKSEIIPRTPTENAPTAAGDNVAPKSAKQRVFNLSGNQKELQSKIVSELKKRRSMFKDDDESNTSSTDSDWLVKGEAQNKDLGAMGISGDLTAADDVKGNRTSAKEDVAGDKSEPSVGKDSSLTAAVPKQEIKTIINPVPIISKSSELPTSSAPAAPEVSKKVTSLFGDESSDEDFFEKHIIKTSLSANKSLSSSLKTAASTTKSLTENKPKNKEKLLEKKATSKLFSSSEDDDDNLFLTKAKPTPTPSTINPIQSQAQTQPKKSTAKAVTLSKAIENPLGDLFD